MVNLEGQRPKHKSSHHKYESNDYLFIYYIYNVRKGFGKKTHTHTHKTIHMNEQEWGKTGKAEFLASNKSEIWTLD